ncbi:MAG: hypothetical protein G01um101477_435 [Candidatus Doudnabacteria bacterium Gr01-1014_77]|uniref:Uncharacterized protein n=1 Tax=Candidatus Doudnabacteria bacterium Gr01-1014_77 TaxID=2017133 RepID=A0A554JB69_9BACT|nr:MAG: hypothetical protein G01um101477_435 [Candidatus Doudnabacteria bacterium Gr01-1014_77]
MNQELSDYVTKARAMGSDDAKIKEELLIAGWNVADVEQALATSVPAAQNTVPEVSTATPVTFKERLKDKKLWESIGGLVLIIAGGFYFFMVYASGPEKVWNKLSPNNFFTEEKGWHKHELTIVYADTSGEKKTSANAKIDSDILLENDKVIGNGNIAGGYSYSGASFSFDGIEMRFLDNSMYINLKNIPFMYDFLQEYDGWLKVDSKTVTLAAGTEEDQKLEQEVLGILQENKVVSGHKYLGKEEVLGKQTFHYALDVDKQALINSYKQISKLGNKNASELSEEDFKSVFDGITVSDIKVDLWLGTSDSEVYRILVNVKMPNFLEKARGKSDDAKVLAHIRQIGLGLKLYHNDRGYYPESLNELSPLYLYEIPIPTKINALGCTIKDVYAYKSLNNKSTYSLKGCIGSDTALYTAGILESTPAGINTFESHPEWNNVDLTKLPLNTSLNIDWKIVPSSPVSVTAPAKYYDASSQLSQYGSDTPINQASPSDTLPVDQFSR